MNSTADINACPACAGDLGWTAPAVIEHLGIHDDTTAEQIVLAINEASVLSCLSEVAHIAVAAKTPFDELPGWVQRRTHADVYEEALRAG